MHDDAPLPSRPSMVSDQIGADLVADVEVTCPRCGQVTIERLYGPCSSCRVQLQETQGNEGSDIAAPEYEPSMNVTPNAVALKE